MNELKISTAQALLEAIAEAAPDANDRGNEALESLARAYAAVVTAAPKDAAPRATARVL